MARYLLAQHHLLKGSAITSTTSEAGPTIGQPVESAVDGDLKLGAAGAPTASVTLDLELQAGGNPTGFDQAQAGAGAGAELVWRETGEADTLSRAWNARDYLTWAECPPASKALYGWQSPPRTLNNGSVGYVTYKQGVADSIRFLHKSTRTGTWTNVTIFTDGDDGLTIAQQDHRPGFVVLPDGRIIAYFLTAYSGTGNAVTSYYSDDHGATWTLFRKISAVVGATHTLLNAETEEGEVVLVTGAKAAAGVAVYHSVSGGVGFAQRGATFTTYYRPVTTKNSAGQVVVLVDDNAGAAFVAVMGFGGRLDNSEFWTAQTVLDGASTFGNNALVTDDRGTVWAFITTQQSEGPLSLIYSIDGGYSWTQNFTNYFVLRFYGSGGNDYVDGITAGMWFGNLIVLGVGNPAGGSNSPQYALWFGGWSPMVGVERPVYEDFGGPYNMSYLAIEEPTGLGWSKADSGTGATITETAGYLNIVADASGNSLYSPPASWISLVDDNAGFRQRFFVRINSGGSSGRRCVIEAGITDTTNIQKVEIRFSTTTMTVVDGAGNTLGTSTPLADFTSWTEVWVAFEHEGGSASNLGKVTVCHRVAGQTTWIKVVDAVDVAETAGAANIIKFGGDTNGAVDWDLILLEMANDHAGVAEFDVPDDLVGRPLGVEGLYLKETDVRVHAFGTGGVSGDTWDLDTSAKYPSTYIVDTDSPQKHWRSDDDGTANYIVFDAGANGLWMGDLWMLMGTNMPAATLEFNASDSWGAPSVSLSLSALMVDSVGINARGKGYVKSSTLTTMENHRYASRPGRRRFLKFTTSGNLYEITDNSADKFYFDGLDMSSETGGAQIYGDGMYDTTSQVVGYRYMRLGFAVQDTSDGYFTCGRLQAGFRLAMTSDGTEYDKGFRDVTSIPVDLMMADGGARYAQRLGEDRRSLLVQWHPAYRSDVPIDLSIDALYRRLGGQAGVVGFVRDTADTALAENGGLYRIVGRELVRSNIFDEGTNATVKVDALRLEEER
jgi:hypothetical protein